MSGINREFALTTDQSCLNRWLTEVQWDVTALNDRRLAWLQQAPRTRYSVRGVIAIDRLQARDITSLSHAYTAWHMVASQPYACRVTDSTHWGDGLVSFVPTKKRKRIRLCSGQKDGPFALPNGNSYPQICHEATLLGSLVVAIATLESYIVTTTDWALPVCYARIVLRWTEGCPYE